MPNEIHTIADAAEAAERLEREAKAEPDNSVYIHKFKTPFTWEGKTYEQLMFQWSKLTGADHLEIENELLMRGTHLVVPEYTSDFLCGMATRACEELKGTDANRRGKFIRALPLRDFQIICNRARSFLLRAGL